MSDMICAIDQSEQLDLNNFSQPDLNQSKQLDLNQSRKSENVNSNNANVSSNNAMCAETSKELEKTFKHLKKIENLNICNTSTTKNIINFNSKKNINIELKGRHLYQTIPELRDLSTIMEHPEFYKFYYKYMQDLNKFKKMIVLMKLYDIISHYLYKKDPHEKYHNSYYKLVLIYNLVNSPEYSRILFKKICNDNQLICQ